MREHGAIAGNPAANSRVKLSNRHRFSYPGYAELLLGRAHDDQIDSNRNRPSPYPTVLEFLQRKLDLTTNEVATFACWEVFEGIVAHEPGNVFVNAGYAPYSHPDPIIQQLSRLQSETRTPWDTVRHDAYAFRFAMAHLRDVQPRVLYLALGETDDWAHDKRYDRVLQALHQTDQYLKQLWAYLQSHAPYRNQTTLFLTTDHGRGNTPSDWPNHGSDVEGAQWIWLATISPDSSLRGEWSPKQTIHLNQVAATACQLLGLDYSAQHPEAGRPIAGLFD